MRAQVKLLAREEAGGAGVLTTTDEETRHPAPAGPVASAVRGQKKR